MQQRVKIVILIIKFSIIYYLRHKIRNIQVNLSQDSFKNESKWSNSLFNE